MDSLAMAISGGWAAGISAYAAIVVIGLAGRLGIADTPDVLQRTEVLIVVGAFTIVEFVIDKIRYLDSVWDTVHTVARPILAGVLGWLIAGAAGSDHAVLITVLSACAGMLSHVAKAGVRLAVNASPEPASNVTLSIAENAMVVGVLLLTIQSPELGAGVAIVLMAAAYGMAITLHARVKEGWRTIHHRYFTGISG